MFLLNDGTDVTADEIRAAFSSGKATLVHSNGENRTKTGLMLDGKHYDTRGQCYSVWEEVWTTEPESLQEAFFAAGAGGWSR